MEEDLNTGKKGKIRGKKRRKRINGGINAMKNTKSGNRV